MKKILFASALMVALVVTINAQNLRFWTEIKDTGNKYIVTIYTGHVKAGGAPELLQGVNLRYYYESSELKYEAFGLSPVLLNAGFQNMGGQGNNKFAERDLTQHGKADRFAGHSPFVFDAGLEVKAAERVIVGTLTFSKTPQVRSSDIDAYLVGANIFKAMTYTALPGCTKGCPVIVTIPPGPSIPGEGITLEVNKYGPNHSHLTWVVDSPEEMQGYVVERMIGETVWEHLTSLKGDGQYVHVYIDENAYDDVQQKQSVSYRIRVNTENGDNFSNIERIEFASQKMFIEVYPNPASDNVDVTMTATKTDGTAYLEMYSTDGRLVYRSELQSGTLKEQIDLASANVNSGSYTVHLVSSGKILDVRPLYVMR